MLLEARRYNTNHERNRTNIGGKKVQCTTLTVLPSLETAVPQILPKNGQETIKIRKSRSYIRNSPLVVKYGAGP